MHGINPTHHGIRNVPPGVVEVDTLIVRETKTLARILWQNGTITENVSATDLIPYANPDEYDCWPGDYVLWKSEDETQAGIVQHVNAYERTAQLHWKDPPPTATGAKGSSYSLVSVMELDPHGTSTPSPEQMDCIGVRRGEFVMIHQTGTTNGSVIPRVPKIGELEPWSKEGNPHGWRFDMAHVGMEYANRNAAKWQNDGLEAEALGAPKDETRVPGAFDHLKRFWDTQDEVDGRLNWKNASEVEWFGEVTNVSSYSPKLAVKCIVLIILLMRDSATDIWGGRSHPTVWSDNRCSTRTAYPSHRRQGGAHCSCLGQRRRIHPGRGNGNRVIRHPRQRRGTHASQPCPSARELLDIQCPRPQPFPQSR